MNSTRKFYCVQTNPAIQESPELDSWAEDVILTGNKRFVDFNADFEPWKLIQQQLDSAGVDYLDRMPPVFSSKSLNDLLHQYGFYPPECANRKNWTAEEINQWLFLLNTFRYSDDVVPYLPALALLTGEEWAETTLRGSSQSDWQTCIYRKAGVNEDTLKWLEAAYFNTGTEWTVAMLETPPTADELAKLDGYTVYCANSYLLNVQKEIAVLEGVTPEQVVLYEYVGRKAWIDAWWEA